MKLEPLMTFRAVIGESLPIGQTPSGNRSIARVTSGSFEGPGLKGEILEPGADWVRITDDGFGQVDVRLAFKTDDGDLIYVRYEGLLEFSEAVSNAMAGGEEMAFGDNYFATQIRFETGSSKYGYLNQVIAVGEGRLLGREVEYRCFKVVPSPQ
ncbi:MAG: DUF3237 domain-containing protein [Pseudomonadales bacterium]